MAFETAQSMLKSQQGNYQDSIIWFYGKAILRKKILWEFVLAIQHLQMLVTVYYKDNLEKPIVTSAPVNMGLSMVKPTTPQRPQPISDIPIKQK